MADYNSALPIRSEGDVTEKVQVRILDATVDANKLAINSDGEAKVEVHGDNPTGGDETLRLSELGAAAVDGVYDGTNNTDPSNIGLVAAQRAASPADSDQIKRLTAITNSTVHALDISLHDEAGAAFSESNPLPVTLVDSEGTEVNDYNTSVALAAGGTSNHDYTVTALKTLKLSQIFASASGKLKVTVQVETGVATGVFNTRFVGFNSTANPNVLISVNENITVAAGVRVRVIRMNNDNQAQDVYSTISGHEI